MARQLKLIKEIHLEERKWCVKIIVAEKGMPKISRYGSKKYQSLLLCDSEGTKTQATIYDNDIKIFRDTLTLLGSYYISNAAVKCSKPQYRILDNQYEWIINKYTLIEEVPAEESFQILPQFSFTPFANFQEHMDRMTSVDVIAAVVDVYQKKVTLTRNGQQEIQEAVLINEEKKPMMLTFWDQFVGAECAAITEILDTNPVVVAKRLKVVSFNGLSLSTKSSSSFMINPNIPEVASLQAWLNQNENYVRYFVTTKPHLTSPSTLTMPSLDLLTNINAMQPEMQTTSWIKAHVSVINRKRQFWYMACNNCHKITGADFNQSFSCIYCGKADAKGAPRCRINVELSDSTGVIQAMVFGKVAEEFLLCSAKELMENTSENGIQNLPYSISLSSDEEYVIYIKATKPSNDNIGRYQYTVLAMLRASTQQAKVIGECSNMKESFPEENIHFFDASSTSVDSGSGASNDPTDVNSEVIDDA